MPMQGRSQLCAPLHSLSLQCARLHNNTIGIAAADDGSVNDELVDVPALWQRAVAACPLQTDVRLAYLSHIRCYAGSSLAPHETPNMPSAANGVFDSVPSGLVDVGRCVQSLCAHVGRDAKNKMAARSLSRGGGGSLLTLPPPPRLQVLCALCD
jgi:hypothetical protein